MKQRQAPHKALTVESGLVWRTVSGSHDLLRDVTSIPSAYTFVNLRGQHEPAQSERGTEHNNWLFVPFI